MIKSKVIHFIITITSIAFSQRLFTGADIQVKVTEKSLSQLVEESRSKCELFNKIPAICEAVLKDRKSLEMSWLFCHAYLDVLAQLCDKKITFEAPATVKKNPCEYLKKIYSSYYTQHVESADYIKSFKEIKNEQCIEFCSQNKDICSDLIVANEQLQSYTMVPTSSAIVPADVIRGDTTQNKTPRLQSNEQSPDKENADAEAVKAQQQISGQDIPDKTNQKKLSIPRIQSKEAGKLNNMDENKVRQQSPQIEDKPQQSRENVGDPKAMVNTDGISMSKNENTKLDSPVNNEDKPTLDQIPKKGDNIADTQVPQPAPEQQDYEQQESSVHEPVDIDNEDDLDHEIQLDQNINMDKTPKLKVDDEIRNTDHLQLKTDQSSNFVETEDSHFFVYLLCGMAICVLGYILVHNKNKLLAMALEGRRGSGNRGGRRRHTASYRKLDSNIEEAITSTGRSNFNQVIY